jgi:hypothetical protein
VNQRVTGAVTVTSPHAFTSAQPVARNIVAVNQAEVASAPAAVRAPAVVPPKQAVLGAGAASNFHPPAAALNRQVVAKTTPPPPPPSFAARQAAIEKNQGQPLSMAQTRQLQTAENHPAAPVKIAPPAKPAPVTYNQQGSRENNNPGPLNTNRPVNNSANAPNNSPNRPANTQTSVHQDRPPSARPGQTNPQLEQKHQQEITQLQQKQDQEYQKLQTKQTQETQKLQQQNAKPEAQQQAQQKQQQELQTLQQKQQQEQQNLKQKQAAEHAKAYNNGGSNKDEKHNK